MVSSILKFTLLMSVWVSLRSLAAHGARQAAHQISNPHVSVAHWNVLVVSENIGHGFGDGNERQVGAVTFGFSTISKGLRASRLSLGRMLGIGTALY